ncbi:MAG TPA: histidine ammonia-lyase, partial [Thermoanaerobacter sp.]|nr:histidine ammonia-lyase [Thermoanaerobacter sp.]
MGKVIIDGNNLTIEDVVHVARDGYRVELSSIAEERVLHSRKIVERYVNDEKVV